MIIRPQKKLSESGRKGAWGYSTIAARGPREPLWDPKILSVISSLSLFQSAKQVLGSSQDRSERTCKRETGRKLFCSLSLAEKTNKKWCVWKYLPSSCLFLSCDIISHVGHQSCSELMTHPAHESFSSFPQPQQGMLGLFLLSSCWSKAVPEPGQICQHRHFDLSLWNR